MINPTCSVTEAHDQIRFFQRWHSLDPSEQLELARDLDRRLKLAQLRIEELESRNAALQSDYLESLG